MALDTPAPAGAASFRENRTLQGMTLAYFAFWAWMAIHPYSRFDWFLENLLTFATVGALIFTHRSFRFSNLSYFLLLLFLGLHTLGASYSYTTTPIDVLMHRLLPSLQRDDFDRVVHFSFGLLLAYPVWEFLLRVARVRSGFWGYALTVITILSAGAFYELIEMWVAKAVAPEIGTLFLGTQGDPWDTQQDMAVALYGAMITMSLTATLRRMRSRQA